MKMICFGCRSNLSATRKGNTIKILDNQMVIECLMCGYMTAICVNGKGIVEPVASQDLPDRAPASM